MTFLAGVLAAFFAALIYTAAAICLKRALQFGATSAQVNVAANLGMAVMAQPLWLLARPDVPDMPLWQPLVCAVFFLLGQAFSFAALERGDVSLATPLLGTKILIVTGINVAVFQTPVTVQWWLAAAAASLSVALIAGGGKRHHRVGLTTVLSLAGAFCYSLTDVWLQHWGPGRDTAAFAPILFGASGVIALAVYGTVDRSAFRPPRAARTMLFAGAAIFGLQIILFFFALVWTRDATMANVIYSSRSVWSVVAAWAGGHLLGLRDGEAGPAAMLRRLLGSVLLLGAIVLVLW